MIRRAWKRHLEAKRDRAAYKAGMITLNELRAKRSLPPIMNDDGGWS